MSAGGGSCHDDCLGPALAKCRLASTAGNKCYMMLPIALHFRGRKPMAEATHSELIQDQFTRQAGVFNAAGTITNEQALKMIIEAGQAGSNDTVLDVAC